MSRPIFRAHTPGPWEFRPLQSGHSHSAAPGYDIYQAGMPRSDGAICKLPASTKPTAANARLIAAAPDLLAALQALVALADTDPFILVGHAIEHRVPAARAAINRATGGEAA